MGLHNYVLVIYFIPFMFEDILYIHIKFVTNDELIIMHILCNFKVMIKI